MLYCAKHLPQHAGMGGWLEPPVGCGNGGAVPGRCEREELSEIDIELEDVEAGVEDVLGTGAAVPVLPKQNDWTHSK